MPPTHCCKAAGLMFWLLLSLTLAGQETDWRTDYEKSGYLDTPRYPETVAYCQRLAEASPWIEYRSFGTSPQGRELPLVILDRNGNFTPESVRASGNAVMLVLNCIHAGECDGKDASLILLREIAISKTLAALADNVTLLVIPIFNVDGHERFGPYNRLNQNGPREMGFRVTAQRYNLNRDFLKAQTPEMQAWLKLYRQWEPDFMVDNHVTDGADHQYVLTYGIETEANVAPPLRRWTLETLEPYLAEKMKEDNFLIARYFFLRNRPQVSNGLSFLPYSPRFSTGYGAAQNRIFYLVEMHALKDYQTRVNGNFHLMKHMLTLLNREKDRLLEANRQSDAYSAKELPGRYLPLDFQADPQDSTLRDFAGIEYQVEQSEISGGPRVIYGSKPQTMQVPYFDHIVATDSARIPYAYLIPPQWQFQIGKLIAHGVRVDYLSEALTREVESYRFRNISWARQPFEGQFMPTYESESLREERHYPAGSAVVIMNQHSNRLIAHLLEPDGPDSFVKWGFWNNIFERKEYGEDYMLETIARQMLRDDPALEAEFRQYLADNPSLAENRWARLYFFYARTPYWEDDVNLYPVGKLAEKTALPLR